MPPGPKIDLEYAREVLRLEAEAISGLAPRLGKGFVEAAETILGARGQVILTGMGKAGIIAQKIAATFSSTGVPAAFLHPAEALHGDLGMVRPDDVVIALSKGGATEEVVSLIPYLKKIGAKLIALTGNPASELARRADVLLDMGEIKESCHYGIVPSASTTAMLALGDALALSVFKARGVTREEFGFFHPAGSIGKRLVLEVRDIMRTGSTSPAVKPGAKIRDVLLAITSARAGAASVVDDAGRLVGIFTDGDLRRHMDRADGIMDVEVGALMTRNPIRITPERLAAEALCVMKERKIDELPVVDESGCVVGMLDVQDLLAAGLV